MRTLTLLLFIQALYNNIKGSKRFFSTSRRADRLWPNQPFMQWVPAALYLEVRLPMREADYSSPCNAEVNNGVAIPPLSQASSGSGGLLST
jgi:hypothetical protein